MKTRIIFLLLLIVSFSCGTNNKPLSDAQKEKIKGEVKEVVNTFFKGCEEVNFDMALKPFLDSPDFLYINNGYAFNYKDCEVAKDTTCFWDVKSYGTGFDCYFKYVSKGKIVMDGKQLWGYDKKLDKCSMSEMIKGMDNSIYLSWFTSNNKATMLSYGDISNPDNASTKWDVEFKSPDLFVEKMIINGKLLKTFTMTRIK